MITKIHNRSQAIRFLKSWMWRAKVSGNKYTPEFVNTLRNWWDEFLNYFNKLAIRGTIVLQ